MYRRAVITVIVGLLALVVLAPFSGFDLAAFITWIVFAVLYVPPWERIPVVGRFIPPLGLLAVVGALPVSTTRTSSRSRSWAPSPTSTPGS